MLVSFHSLVLLAVCAAAVPHKPVSRAGNRIITKLTKPTPSKRAYNILAHDQARVQALGKAIPSSKTPSSPEAYQPLDNQEFDYTAPVCIGNDSTIYNLLVDTGSSITWLGAKEPYHKSPNGVETDDDMSVDYGSQSFEGELIINCTLAYDSLRLADDLIVNNQSIGVAKKVSTGFYPLDGVFGLGPTALTEGTVSSGSHFLVPTILDTLYAEGTIYSKIFGLGFEPTDFSDVRNGEITWGGIDESRTDGPVHYVNITDASPANRYWGFNQSISYGNDTILDSTSGIIYSGMRLCLLPSAAYEAYKAATGAEFDWRTQLLRIPAERYSELQSLYFIIDGVSFELTPNAQIWPRTINWFIGGTRDYVYSIIGQLGDRTDPGIGFVLGYTFLERFYSVYDVDNRRIGLARTPYTYAESN
ncbi:family A1 protease [Pluteus cervinus]|uniref:Family A1 protease n=1 Tax=Pluteus cervinus TaxID=181527 RepID=A0ACD3ANP2_9AGAR|nr:family A1 protease [Pluteus cervinus]